MESLFANWFPAEYHMPVYWPEGVAPVVNEGVAAFSAVASLAVTGHIIVQGSASITGAGLLAVTGYMLLNAVVVLVATGQMNVIGTGGTTYAPPGRRSVTARERVFSLTARART